MIESKLSNSQSEFLKWFNIIAQPIRMPKMVDIFEQTIRMLKWLDIFEQIIKMLKTRIA